MATVLADARGSVRVLTLNRPGKLNAADLDMQRSLLAELEVAARDGGLRALVLTGAGRAFSAGGDRGILEGIVAGESPIQDELSMLNRKTTHMFLALEVPVIAAVSGPAIGWGAGLVALCDLVVMGAGSFLSDPHVRHGIAADPATQAIWPRRCSELVARDLLLTGRKVGAEEALRIGLCNRVCADGEELATALAIADDIAALPAAGIAETRRRLNAPLLEMMGHGREAGG